MATKADDVLEIFTQINRVPRCSKNEAAIAAWLENWASDHGFACERDEVGNVLMRVPAKGSSGGPVVIQGHMDMVCEKTPGSSHDFARDAVPVIRDGDWVHANDTTLGADNGIAIAMALAVAAGDGPHPELEILITVDEETGLTGAQRLREGWLRGSSLINIDSEDEGVFTIGCAGGVDTHITLPVNTESVPPGYVFREIAVGGLMGGHSGVDIHLQRANANVLLGRILLGLRDADVRIAGFRGGNAHNAIPRDASAVVAVPEAAVPSLDEAVAARAKVFREEYAAVEPGLETAVRTVAAGESVLDRQSGKRFVDLLLALPHGVIRMSSEVAGLVETSTNLATVRLAGSQAKINTSQRSSFVSRLDELDGRITAIARLAGASVEKASSYPPWEPAVQNALLAAATSTYRELFGKDPEIEIIHAGLECGVIGSKYPELAMLSIGPTIERAHSPEERLHVPSLEKVCRFLDALLVAL
jgi:dipeptidase D